MNFTPSQVTNLMRTGLRLLFDPDPSDEEKALALQHFNRRCAYCGEPSPKLHLDHVIASSERYGHNHISNRIPACAHCNANEKRDIPWRNFIAWKWKDDPAKRQVLTQQLEIWLRAWETTPKPAEFMLDLLEVESARVKAEYGRSVARIRKAKMEANRTSA